MGEICPKCGLPKELCVCEAIARGEQQIEIKVVKRRFGKTITIVSGFDDKTINIKDLARKLKSTLACGGTTKENRIELQGDHMEKVRQLIIAEGFPGSSITTKRETERK